MTAAATAYRLLKYGAVASLLVFLATCELLPLPAHSFGSRERTLIDSREALIRVIAGEAMGRRRSLFPGVPERTPDEVHASHPEAWRIRRTLLGYASAWEVTVSERVAGVERPGNWEGVFQADPCADRIEASWMVTYDDERPEAGGQGHR